MGILGWPRLYFAGYNYWNPSTFNNNDYDPPIDTYDQANAQLNWAYLRSQGVDSGEAFKRWSIRPRTADVDHVRNKVPPAEWGYFGGNECGFVTQDRPFIENPIFYKPPENTRVTGYTGPDGRYVDTGDPWLQQPLQFNLDQPWDAKLVDVDSTCFWSSQIFADSFTLGTPDLGFSAPVTQRLFSRWQYLRHNYNADHKLMIAGPVSAIFQTAFATADIRFNGSDSPLAQALQKALQAPDAAGLMLRFIAYDTLYFQGSVFHGRDGDKFVRMEQIARLYQQYTEELAAYKAGKTTTAPIRPVNRAYSRVVGWVGIWRRGEWATAPNGRLLLPLIQPGQPAGLPQPQPAQPRGLPCLFYTAEQDNPPKAPTTLGPATVEVLTSGTTIDRLAVDLGTALPERDSTGARADFGVVQLELELPDARVVLATLADTSAGADYQATYERTAGIVDVPGSALPPSVTANQINNNPLLITVISSTPTDADCSAWSGQRVLALTENPLTAQTDDRGVYVNQPGAPWRSADESVTFTVGIRAYGGAPAAGTRLAVAQYGVDGANGIWSLVKPRGEGFAPYVDLIRTSGARRLIGNTTQLAADTGVVTIAVRALRPGQPNLAFFPLAPGVTTFQPPPVIPFPQIAASFYTIARALPFHNEIAAGFDDWLRTGPEIDIVNQWVFDAVFGTYALMYPVMDFIADPLKFQEWRGRILVRTDPLLFNSGAYMPVTRALSAGQRRILELYHEYLQTVPGGLRTQQLNKAQHRLGRG